VTPVRLIESYSEENTLQNVSYRLLIIRGPGVIAIVAE
jgi:hypothetical protein